MNKLKIYWESNNIKIVEPSGKIHNSDMNKPDGVNLIEFTFMKKYIGHPIELYSDLRSEVPKQPTLATVDIMDDNTHYFEVI